jgi:hypothetical protein
LIDAGSARVGSALLALIALCAFAGGCGAEAMPESPPTRTQGGEMVILSIHLQDGFSNDTVLIEVNGKRVYEQKDVTTKLLLGKADSTQTEVEIGPVHVQVEVRTQDLADTIELEVSAATYLGISVVDGEIEFMISDEPFGYA